MNIVPASSYLVDFSHEDTSGEPQIAPAEIQPEEVRPNAVEMLPELELIVDPANSDTSKDQAAYDEAKKAEIAEALAQQEARLQASHQAEIEKLNATFSDQLTQKFTHQFEKCLGRIEDEISQGVLAIIEPFLDASIRERAMSDLLQAVEGIKHDLSSTTVTLRGKQHELDKLCPSLESMGLHVNRVTSEVEEVSLEIDDMWIETRFQGWKNSLYQRPNSQANS